MTPGAINHLHGGPAWSCAVCQTAENLHWWGGMSVAICQSKECDDTFTARVTAEQEHQASLDEYNRELHGDA